MWVLEDRYFSEFPIGSQLLSNSLLVCWKFFFLHILSLQHSLVVRRSVFNISISAQSVYSSVSVYSYTMYFSCSIARHVYCASLALLIIIS